MTSPASADRGPFSGAARFADDTRRRFLATIVAHVPLDRLVEVHLFPPIRQGGVETGVAVIAARPCTAEATTAEATTAEATTTELITTESGTAEAITAESDATACDPTEDAATAPADFDAASSHPAASDSAVSDSAVSDSAVPDSAVPDAASPDRHTVFTARYRITIRGPDRGRWDADVVEEADAPLVTVEAVVRGVQRRAGDIADPDRLGPDVVARLVGAAPSPPPAPNASRAP